MAKKSKFSAISSTPGDLNSIWQKAGLLEKEAEDLAGFKANVAKLPYDLREEYNKRADPALNAAISSKQNQVLGGAIEGLNKYQDISNPFERRALAEKYQSGLSTGLASLTDERTRRQGVYEDYITKWSGLYGAEAAKRADIFNAKKELLGTEMTIANQIEDKRRWEITNARAGRGEAKENEQKAFRRDVEALFAAHTGEDQKVNPEVYDEARNLAYVNFGLSPDEFDSIYGNRLAQSNWSGDGWTRVKTKDNDDSYVTETEFEYDDLGNEKKRRVSKVKNK